MVEINFIFLNLISITLEKRVLLEKWIILVVSKLSAAYQKLRRDIVDRLTLHLPWTHNLIGIGMCLNYSPS